MKLFIDTIEIERVAPYAKLGIIDGVTINPSSLSHAKNPLYLIQSYIQLLPESDICVQVTHQDPVSMLDQAQRLAALSENIVIKVPALPGYLELINHLEEQGIRVNATLVASVQQVMILAPLGVSYVSVFMGRLDQAGYSGLTVVQDVQDFLDTYDYETELMVSSIRTTDQVASCASLGADAITMPIDVFEQLMVHDLSIAGLETFMHDWKEGGKQLP
jgi:transaldolase